MSYGHMNNISKTNSIDSGKTKRKRPFSCLSACFFGSPVCEFSDIHDELLSSVGAKRKLSPWLSWSRIKRRKKKKDNIAHDGFIGNSTMIGDRKGAPAAEKRFSGDNPAKFKNHIIIDKIDQQLKLTTINQKALHSEQPSPTQIITKPNLLIETTAFGLNSNQVRVGPRTNKLRTNSGVYKSNLPRNRGAFGLWLMMMTLGVMVFSGRAAAVFCLCSCLYLMPMPRVANFSSHDDRITMKEFDINSNEYKKKVILEGLLERNRQKLAQASVKSISTPKRLVMCHNNLLDQRNKM